MRWRRPLDPDLPVEAWGDVLADVPGMSESLIAHLKAVAIDHQNGIFSEVTDVVERVGGAPAQPLSEFINVTKGSFGLSGRRTHEPLQPHAGQNAR